MRAEDFDQLQLLAGTLDLQFGAPATPEKAIQRVLIAVAALVPLNTLTTQQGAGELLPVIAEWFTPMVGAAIEEAAGRLSELYDALESEADDVQVMEPGTIGNQQFTDLGGGGAIAASSVQQPGPQGVPRGELIR